MGDGSEDCTMAQNGVLGFIYRRCMACMSNLPTRASSSPPFTPSPLTSISSRLSLQADHLSSTMHSLTANSHRATDDVYSGRDVVRLLGLGLIVPREFTRNTIVHQETYLFLVVA